MESQRAGREAAEEAMKNLKVPKADAAVVLASSVFNQAEMLAGIREVTGDIPTVGCTAAGVITNSGPHEQAVAVLLLQSDVSSFHPIKIEKISQDMRKAGAAFGDAVKSVADGKAKMALIFSDALSGNGTELVRGVLTSLGAQFPLVGGAAGDDMNFKQTFQYFNGEALNDAAV